MAKDLAKTPQDKCEFPERPWQCLHIDYAGPFLEYMRPTIVYKSTIRVVIPTKHMSAENTIEMLLDVFAINGLCE